MKCDDSMSFRFDERSFLAKQVRTGFEFFGCVGRDRLRKEWIKIEPHHCWWDESNRSASPDEKRPDRKDRDKLAQNLQLPK
jgi:hypothetical protein